MKTRLLLSLSVTIMLLANLSFVSKTEQRVMVYGIVYKNACISHQAYQTYYADLCPKSSSQAAKEYLEKKIAQEYPGAEKRVKSSDYFLSTATNMCVIRWTNITNKCQYQVLSIHFGISKQQARDKAISNKNENADKGASYEIVQEEEWKNE